MTQKNWLNIQLDDNNKKLVKTMYCKLCCVYKNEICGLPKFICIWPKDGCAHLQLSATVEHSTRGPQKAAYHKYLTKKGLGSREQIAKVSGWQKTGQMSLVNWLYCTIC